MEIITNNHPRHIVDYYELSDKERKEFDYVGEDGEFFRYKGELYYLGNFVSIWPRKSMRVGFSHGVDDNSPLLAWHGIMTDSYFSAIVVKYADDDSVIIGRVFS